MHPPPAVGRLRGMLRDLSTGFTAAPTPAAGAQQLPEGDAADTPGVSPEQVEFYVKEGYVVINGLIPEPILAAARDSIWEQMAGPPKPPEEDAWAPGGAKRRTRPRPQRSNRSTWPIGGWEGMVDGDAISALFTPRWHRAAQTLASAAAEVSGRCYLQLFGCVRVCDLVLNEATRWRAGMPVYCG
eukprot:COSAG02_NODE_9760_length_2118_cov_7.171867_2_plen_185_part_00